MNIVRRYWNYLCTWRKHREMIKKLNSLSARQLQDIGLTRADVNDLIWLPEDVAKRGE